MIIKSATPINRPVQPRYHEGSGLRSPTDSDSLMRGWRKDSRVGESTFGLAVQIAKISRELAKLRRRIIGGQSASTATTSTPGNYAGNWTFQSYSAGTIVRNLINQVVVGGTTYNIQPGVYGCVVDVPGIGGGAGFNVNMLPQYPEPTTGVVYWQLIALAPVMINTCANGQQTIYINASGSF